MVTVYSMRQLYIYMWNTYSHVCFCARMTTNAKMYL